MNLSYKSSWLTAALLIISAALLVAVQPYAAGYGHFRRTLLEEMSMRWKDPTWQHGALLPFIVGFLIWRRRDEVAQFPARTSPWGLVLILFSLLCYLAGFRANNF
ncbi:MAG: eight transrane protein EpsH, partial [Prosthecobacter sp.]|nr:eight transrane protein EpsH [Prosthecobacter sp.]